MMIVQQEDSYSWQDASKSWLEHDEGEEVGSFQVGMCQGASGAPLETGEGAVTHPPTREREDTKAAEDGWWFPEPDDLLKKERRGSTSFNS
jgi:hypothetical protein